MQFFYQIRPIASAVIALTATFLIANPAWSRFALVIGNSKYAHAPLVNPANDARSIAQSLRDSGFTVTEVIDQNRDQMKSAVRAFGDLLHTSKQPGVFYFAGHAVQSEWRNYLLPINQNFANAQDVRNNAVDITELTRSFQSAKNGTNIIILDACRDNPFAAANQIPKGLTQMEAPANTFLAYATAPGQTARDAGSGSNGLYTEHLLKEIVKEGVKIEDVFKRVRLNVRLASNGEQIPWENTSLEEDFFFRQPLQPRKRTERDLEEEFEAQLSEWQDVRIARDQKSVEDYLRKYPSGKFSELANHRLERLLAQKEQRDRDITQLQKQMMASANSAVQSPPIPSATASVAVSVVALASVTPAPVPQPVGVLATNAPVFNTAPKPQLVAVVPSAPVAAIPMPLPAPAPVVAAIATVAPPAIPAVIPAVLPAAAVALASIGINPAANPVVIAASSNPQIDGFAPIRQSGIAPGWRVNDALTYRTTERFGTPRVSSAERRAVQVDDDKITTALGNTYDLFGNPLKIQNNFEALTPPQWFIHEYYVGKKWSTRYKRRSFAGGGDSVVTAEMQVVAREQITLPAGQFDAFKVKVQSFNFASDYNNRSESIIWVDAASSKMVASETRTWDRSSRLMNDLRVDLMAFANGVR